MDNQINIYDNLRQFRIINNKKQFEVAKILDIDESHYGKIERGELDITWSKLVKLADFYNTTLGKLCGQNIGHVISNLTNSPIAMEHSTLKVGDEISTNKLIESVINLQGNLLSVLQKISEKL
jgi:transcriptional regulator with XRE-family HTH domain